MKKIFFSFTIFLPLIWYLNLADQLIWMTPNPDDYAGGVYLASKNPLPVELRLLTTGSIDPSRFAVYVDGVVQTGKLGNTTLSGATFRTKVDLTDGRQTIEVAYSGTNGTVRSSKLTVEYHADKPNLWLYSFGTKPIDLQYTVKDAQDIADLFRQQEGKLYGNVNIVSLFGTDASASNMRRKVEQIQTLSRLEEIHPQDMVILFVSSHGFINEDDGKLYLKGTDFDALAPTESSLPFEKITQNMSQVNCKKLVFIDACHSGAGKGYQGINDAMSKLLAQQNGITAIASSGPDQLSQEDATWQNGAFTEALLKGFNGAADTDADGFVTIDEIWNYVYQTVPPMVYKLKGQTQRPSLIKNGLQDIPVFSYRGVTPVPPPVAEKDSDGDGIADARDACPYEKGTSAYNGCPPPKPKDSDGDGITDDNDNCPYEKGTAADRGCPPPNEYTESAAGIGFTMKKVAGGTFTMGSSDSEAGSDETPHSVTVSGFYMGKYEVTVGEYLKFCTETNTHWPEWLEKGNSYHVETGSSSYYKDRGYIRSATTLPIAGVSWDDAVAYCEWLSRKTGKTYRLPTEAEWEYAAKGGQSYKYAGSDNIDNVAWYTSNSGSKPHPVGQKGGNGYGLFDMSGNLWEWCADWYGSYGSGSSTNPIGPSSGSYRVIRGGSWNYYPQFCCVAFRNYGTPTRRSYYVGFRLVSPQ